MTLQDDVAVRLARTERYLHDTLLPFWLTRAIDREHGGFLTYFGPDGRPTGQTDKTLLMQIRMVFALAHAARAGVHEAACQEAALHGARFVLDHYHDDLEGGWFWIADRDGSPIDDNKIGYGQVFAMYAFGELALATGDAEARAAALRTWDVVADRMADPVHGGYFELMDRAWQPLPGARSGGDRKSFDVHMHTMEALTTMVELTGSSTHRDALRQIIDILRDRMLDLDHGTGRVQFAHDFTPLRAIRFDGTRWGADDDPDDGSYPIETTSFGHNVEFAWLLLRAGRQLGDPSPYEETAIHLCEHCLRFGIDPVHGGVYVDGLPDREPTDRSKQFWQQAETMLGMLDAYRLTGDRRFWDAFAGVQDFVWRRMIAWDGGGEWYAHCDREGSPRPGNEYLGSDFKIAYHTVRSTIGVVERLRALAGSPME